MAELGLTTQDLTSPDLKTPFYPGPRSLKRRGLGVLVQNLSPCSLLLTGIRLHRHVEVREAPGAFTMLTPEAPRK